MSKIKSLLPLLMVLLMASGCSQKINNRSGFFNFLDQGGGIGDSSSNNFTVNLTPQNAQGPYINQTLDLLMETSDDIRTPSVNDFSLSNAVISNMTLQTGKRILIQVDPQSEGPFSISLLPQVLTSAQGRTNQASNIVQLTFDQTRPVVTFTSQAQQIVSQVFPVSLNVSENLFAAIDSSQVQIQNGTLSNWAQTSPTTYNFFVTPLQFGQVRVDFAGDQVSDLAGNLNDPSPGLSRVFDNGQGGTLAVILSTRPQGLSTVRGQFQVQAIFTQDVNSLDLNSFQTSNLTLSQLSQLNPTTFEFTATAQSEGPASVLLPANSVFAANNSTLGNLVSNTLDVNIDTIRPVIGLTVISDILSNGSGQIRVNVSEATSTLDLSHFDISGGTVTAVTQETPTSYLVFVSAMAGTQQVSIKVRENSVFDMARNGNLESAILTINNGSSNHVKTVSSIETLRMAMDNARPGDIIEIAPGIYTFDQTLIAQNSGTQALPITVRAQGNLGSVTLQARFGSGCSERAGFELRGSDWILQKLILTGDPSVGLTSADCYEDGMRVRGLRTRLDHNRIIDWNRGVFGTSLSIATSPVFPDDVIIEGNQVFNTSTRTTEQRVSGIEAYGGKRWSIRKNFVADFIKSGTANPVSAQVLVHGGSEAQDVVIEQNMIQCVWNQQPTSINGRSGITIGTQLGAGECVGSCQPFYQRAMVRSNIIRNCSDLSSGGHGIWASDSRDVAILNNLIESGGVFIQGQGSTGRARGNLLAVHQPTIISPGQATFILSDNEENILTSLYQTIYTNPNQGDFSFLANPIPSFFYNGTLDPQMMNQGDFCDQIWTGGGTSVVKGPFLRTNSSCAQDAHGHIFQGDAP